MARYITRGSQYALLQHLEGVEGGCGEVMELGGGVRRETGAKRSCSELHAWLGVMVVRADLTSLQSAKAANNSTTDFSLDAAIEAKSHPEKGTSG
jgi:hypothetical protein